MERVICNMMLLSNVTEEELSKNGKIPTDFEETLSWEYLCYVRNHPIIWALPTSILYGEHDSLTSFETISSFAKKHVASLTVMRNGEHWFHSEKEMKFLDFWIKDQNLKK